MCNPKKTFSTQVLRESQEGGHSCPSTDNKRGLENPRSFFNPNAKIHITQNHLPHWQQGEAWVFATWRLGDSLPQTKLDQWKQERAIWLSQHPEPWNETIEAEYHQNFSQQIDDWLDQGSGYCVLKDPTNAQIVSEDLAHYGKMNTGIG